MITYKGIISYFEAICDAHQQINSFTYGEIDLFDKDKFTKYPALHLTPTGTAIDDQTIVYGFDVVVFDRYDVASNKMTNEATCLSDSLLILQDICKELTQGKYFINEDTNIQMDVPVVCQPFIDTEPDNCSGWTTTFNVITPNEATACLIPYFNSEQLSGYDFTLPIEADSHNLAWYSHINLSAVMTLGVSERQFVSLNAVVNTLTTPLTLTQTGETTTSDIVKNAFHFNNTDPTRSGYIGYGGVMPSSNMTLFITIKDFSRFGGTNTDNTIFGASCFTNLQFRKLDIKISASTGNIKAVRSDGTAPHPESSYSVCPTNGNSKENAHRRIEPLTIAVRFNTTNNIRIYYNDDFAEYIEVDRNDFDINEIGEFFIGNRYNTDDCDFYMKEFLVVNSGFLSVNDINAIRQWLKYR